jgi:hypothetical protein
MIWITITDVKNRVWTLNESCIAAIIWKTENAAVYLNILEGSIGHGESGVGELEPVKIILSASEAISLSKQLVLPTERANAFVKKDRGQS